MRYSLLVVSGLHNSCAEFDGYEVDREDETIMVAITNSEPAADVACAQLYGTVETRIPLDRDFETGETVNVLVNGLSKTFVIGGSTQDPNQLTTALGAPVQFKVGQRALVEPYGLIVDFLEVVGDSRCPAAVTCIQAGSAKIQARVSSTDDALGFGSLELTLETGVANLLETSVVGTDGHYSLQLLDLKPYPRVAGGREELDYNALIMITMPSTPSKGPAAER